MNGVLILDKPQGFTSFDAVALMRRLCREKKIGHTGTLDPMATGVLPVFVGRATRGVEFFEHAEKTYETVLLLGKRTDTQDVTGRVLEERPVSLSLEDVEDVLPRFRGEILQVPPMYSALKVNGQKLCDLARKGKQVERQPRPITIFELTLLSFEENRLRLRVRCSKGTYIRTLCDDIGAALGTLGCMESLRRTQAGDYSIAESVPLEALLEADSPETYLRGMDSMFVRYPAVTLTPNQEKRCRNGNSFTRPMANGTYRAYGENEEFLMLAKVEDNIMSTIKSFFEV